MWFVCYEVNGKTYYNEFDSEDKAKKCFEEDKAHYIQEWGIGNFKISIAQEIKFE